MSSSSRPWPMVAPLEDAEAEHYRWLLHGLIRGLRARAAARDDDVAIRALETIFDLADELLARLEPPPMPEGSQEEIAALVALVVELDGAEPGVGRAGLDGHA